MRWSVTIGRFGGTAVRVHATFLLFLAWIWFSALQQEGAAAAWRSVLFIFLLFVCVTLHEFGHILVARRYGVRTPEVTLFPIGGVANIERIPEKPGQELAIAIAGPLVNVVIAVLLLLILGKIQPDAMTRLDDAHISLIARLAAANVFLVLFNLIPAFPMDGGRVLRALLAMRFGAAKATQAAATIGQALAFVFGFLGLFGNPLLIFIAIFVYIAAAGEAQIATLKESVRGLTVQDAMETRFTAIPANARLADAVQILLATGQSEFPVVDFDARPLGILIREDIIAALGGNDNESPVSTLTLKPPVTIAPQAALEGVVDQLAQGRVAALCVVDGTGRLVGLFTRQSLTEIMLIKSVRPAWRPPPSPPGRNLIG
jgi:Zn-dependent protease/predicted transcriptional regulator